MITVSVKINRSVDVVWEYFTTIDNWSKWRGGLKKVDPDWQKGAKLVWEIGGSSPITELIPKEKITISGSWMDTTYQFKPEGNAVTIIEVVESSPKGGASFSDGGAAQKAQWLASLQKFKNSIENETLVSNDKQEIVTDIDSKIHHTVKIGEQGWMVKNLNVSHYRNGDPIPQVQPDNEWSNLTTGAWCNYKNDAENGKTFGKLYNWFAVNDPRGLAPEGFHIPTDDEWPKEGSNNEFGGKLKEAGTTHWASPNKGATNESGFTGLPGGFRHQVGFFNAIKGTGNWWSATEGRMSGVWNRILSFDVSRIDRGTYDPRCGFSVRCLKDG